VHLGARLLLLPQQLLQPLTRRARIGRLVHALHDQLLLLLLQPAVLQARRLERRLEPHDLRLERAPIGGGDATLKGVPFLGLLELGGERIELRLPPVELEVTRMHLWGRGGAVVSTCMQGRGALEATRMHLTRPRASDVGDACLEGADRSGPSAVGTLELHKE
jgi:hypothetical protein